jgi:hypothetical protein
MIDDADIERARAVRIEDEVARRGIKLRRSGAGLVGPCPRCGGKDRFSINTRKQTWNCRGCKPKTIKGNVIGLVMHFDGCDFVTAVRTLIGQPRSTTTIRPTIKSDSRVDGDEVEKLKLADEIWRASSPLGLEAVAYFADYDLRYNPHSFLVERKKLIDCHLPENEVPTLGIKYSCFDGIVRS